MTAITDFTTYKTKLAAPTQRLMANRFWSGYNATGNVMPMIDNTQIDQGASVDVPTNSVCTKDTQGTLGTLFDIDSFTWLNSSFKDAAGGASQWLGRCQIANNEWQPANNLQWEAGTLMLIDKLVHTAGLDGTLTSAQTTNLPTAALTRYTDGVGVWAAVERRDGFGTALANWRLSYTNSDGTSGRTSQPVNTVQFGEGDQEIQFASLQGGDIGVRSVESFTLSATTGFSSPATGITLFKPLLLVPALRSSHYIYEPLEGCRFVEIKPSASLWWVWFSQNESVIQPIVNTELTFFE